MVMTRLLVAGSELCEGAQNQANSLLFALG
jgi:hypothetical protein